MIKLVGTFFLLTATTLNICNAEISSAKWFVKKSEHFIVYYKNAPVKYIDEIIVLAEHYYNEITHELGFTRFDNFWTWDARVKIYLYDTKSEYMNETKRSAWSGGHVNVITRELHTYLNMDNFSDVILPHELGHIVFREFVGFKRKLPRWLDEAVVSYLEKDQRADRLMVAKAVVKTSYFMPLSQLSKAQAGFDIMPQVFYAEAASIIEFLVATYGKEKLYEFLEKLRALRFDQDWFDAAREIYGFKSLWDMNEKWMGWLRS